MPTRGARQASQWPAGLIVAAIAAALAPLPFLRALDLVASSGDEGVLLNGALRVARGEVPFRDFASIIPPGSFYLLALAFKTLGERLVAARAVMLVTHASIVLLFLLVLKRSETPLRARIIGLAALVACGPALWFVVSHHWLANAFVLGSAVLLLRWDGEGDRGWLFGAGAAAGCAGLVLQDQGGYWVVAALGVVLLASRWGRWKNAFAFLAGLAAPVLPLVLFLAARSALPEAWHFLVVAPLAGYGRINNQPFASGLWEGWGYIQAGRALPGAMTILQGAYGAARQAADLLMLASYPLSGLALAVALRRGLGSPKRPILPMVLAALWVASVLTVLHRPAMLNMAWGFFAPLLALAACGGGFLGGSRKKRVGVLGYALLLPFVVMAACDYLIFPLLRPGEMIATPAGVVEVAPRDEAAVRLAVEFRRRLWVPGQTVFCYSYCPLYYFLLGFGNPTRFDTYAYTDGDRRAMLIEAKQATPDWVLWDGNSEDKDPMTEWFTSQYAEAARSGRLSIWGRKGGGGK